MKYKPKHRKALWVKPAKKPDRKAAYNRMAANWKKGRICAWCKNPNNPIDLHHSRGSAGKLKMDARFFVPLCRGCHDWVHSHMDTARVSYVSVDGNVLPLLCARGEWNKQ